MDAEQKSMDLGNDVNILSQMLNSREGSLSITQNDLGFVLFLKEGGHIYQDEEIHLILLAYGGKFYFNLI